MPIGANPRHLSVSGLVGDSSFFYSVSKETHSRQCFLGRLMAQVAADAGSVCIANDPVGVDHECRPAVDAEKPLHPIGLADPAVDIGEQRETQIEATTEGKVLVLTTRADTEEASALVTQLGVRVVVLRELAAASRRVIAYIEEKDNGYAP